MIYDITVSVHLPSVHETVEAKDDDEANKIAFELVSKKRMEIDPTVIDITTNVKLSDKNFTCVVDGVYLIRRYSSHFPAKCLDSCRTYHYKHEFEHVFEYVETGKRVTFFGKNPTRITKKLCNDGKINKPECGDCEARFYCYTKK